MSHVNHALRTLSNTVVQLCFALHTPWAVKTQLKQYIMLDKLILYVKQPWSLALGVLIMQLYMYIFLIDLVKRNNILLLLFCYRFRLLKHPVF